LEVGIDDEDELGLKLGSELGIKLGILNDADGTGLSSSDGQVENAILGVSVVDIDRFFGTSIGFLQSLSHVFGQSKCRPHAVHRTLVLPLSAHKHHFLVVPFIIHSSSLLLHSPDGF